MSTLRRLMGRSPKRSVPHLGFVVHGAAGTYPGSAHVRVVRRVEHAAASGTITAKQLNVRAFAAGEDHDHYDAILVQRDAAQLVDVEALVRQARRRSTRLVIDVDDDFVSEYARARLLAQEYDANRLQSIRRLVERADAVMVSTDVLRERMAGMNRSIHVVPNELDPALWPDEEFSRAASADGTIRVLYMGSATHSADLALLREAFEGLKAESGERVILEVIGVTAVDETWFSRIAIPDGGAHYPEFVKWVRELRPRWSFAVAPLVEDYFNAAKSDLKFLEYSRLGLATVASNVAPYFHTRGSGATLVPNDPSSWRTALRQLAEDTPARASAAGAARAYVAERRMFGDLGEWRSILFRSPTRRKVDLSSGD